MTADDQIVLRQRFAELDRELARLGCHLARARLSLALDALDVIKGEAERD